MEIEARRMGILAGSMAEMSAHIGLVGRLVLGESGIAINPEQRTAVGPRIGKKMRAYLLQRLRKSHDEIKHGITHLGPVTFLVRLEPLPLIAGLEVAQKLEERRRYRV